MWIPECGKFLLTESGIRESRALEAGVQLKESGSSDKILESSTWKPESKTVLDSLTCSQWES